MTKLISECRLSVQVTACKTGGILIFKQGDDEDHVSDDGL
jgi:hypothetical protein